jgi:hypothetical protein
MPRIEPEEEASASEETNMRGTIHRLPWGCTVVITGSVATHLTGTVIHTTNDRFPFGSEIVFDVDDYLAATPVVLSAGTIDMLTYRVPSNGEASRELVTA